MPVFEVMENIDNIREAVMEAAFKTGAKPLRLKSHISTIMKTNGDEEELYEHFSSITEDDARAWDDLFTVIDYIMDNHTEVDPEELRIYDRERFLDVANGLADRLNLSMPMTASLLATRTPLPELDFILPSWLNAPYNHKKDGADRLLLMLPDMKDGDYVKWRPYAFRPKYLQKQYKETYLEWSDKLNGVMDEPVEL